MLSVPATRPLCSGLRAFSQRLGRRLTALALTVVLPACLLSSCATEPSESAAVEATADTTGTDTTAGVVNPFLDPSGPHQVGMREIQWQDETRLNPWTRSASDSRRVPVRFWYPAKRADNGPPQADESEQPNYILDPNEYQPEATQAALSVRSHSALEAPIDDQAGPYPVILYNPGGGWGRFVGTGFSEDLASHGYVVVSVGHDGFNSAVSGPDGEPVDDGALPFPKETGDMEADALASWQFLEDPHFIYWVADAVFVLDKLQELNRTGPFRGSLDLDRIGAYGWSFGGATSIQLLADGRVQAAVNFDGQLFGSAHQQGAPGPFLIVQSGSLPQPPPAEDPEQQAAQEAAFATLVAMVDEKNSDLLARSSGDGQIWKVEGASHGSFGDLMYLFTEDDALKAKAHVAFTSILREFFGHHLLSQPSPFLEDPTSTIPEVTVVARTHP